MKITIIGGAGFIGSNLAHALLKRGVDALTIYDNFSSGKRWHLEDIASDKRLKIIEADVLENDKLLAALEGADFVYHLASNPDIAKAATEPAIDFDKGTLLSHRVIEAARCVGVGCLIYASGSGVFGDNANLVFDEEQIAPAPTSTYAASKIAGEMLLSAYSHMFGLAGVTFRFANVVGPNQTHGVGYDFIRKLRTNPARLDVLGNGTQSKSYIYIDDVIAGLTMFLDKAPRGYQYFNLSTEDYITVRDIVTIVTSEMGLSGVEVQYGSSPKGWSGDVPVIRFTASKIRKLGWRNRHSSEEAMRLSIRGMLGNAVDGRLGN